MEDIPDDLAPPGIADRVQQDLVNFMSTKNLPGGARACVGMVLCGADYESVDEILSDIDVARRLSLAGQQHAHFDRDRLLTFRGLSTGGERA